MTGPLRTVLDAWRSWYSSNVTTAKVPTNGQLVVFAKANPVAGIDLCIRGATGADVCLATVPGFAGSLGEQLITLVGVADEFAILDLPLNHVAKTFYREGPLAADSFPLGYMPKAATMVRVVAVTDVGTVTFNIEKRSKLTPDVAGTNIFTTDKVATASGLDQTAFDSGAIAADTWLNFSASAIATSPTKLWLAWDYTID